MNKLAIYRLKGLLVQCLELLINQGIGFNGQIFSVSACFCSSIYTLPALNSSEECNEIVDLLF